MRVLARDHDEVDDGWLCDKGRFAYQSRPRRRAHHAAAGARGRRADARELGEGARRRRQRAQEGGRRAPPRWPAARPPTRRRSCSQQLFREGLGSGHLASRAGGELPLDVARALADPALQATRPRPRVRPHRRAARVRPGRRRADPRPAHPQGRAPPRRARGRRQRAPDRARPARRRRRCAPRRAAARRCWSRSTPRSPATTATSAAPRPRRAERDAVSAARRGADRARGEDIVIVYGERLLAGPRRRAAARALLNVAARLGLAGRDGAGLLEIPSATNGRGLREAGFAARPRRRLRDARPSRPRRRRDRRGARRRRAHHALPAARRPAAHASRTARCGSAALGTAQTVIAHESVLTETMREHADVVFPAEAYAEKEGTLAHPDGRVQRLRPAIGRPRPTGAGRRRARRLAGHRRRRRARRPRPAASPPGRSRRAQLFEAVPFYAGLTLDEIGGRGVRWPAREAGRALRGAGRGSPRRSTCRRARAPRAPRARCGSAPTARCGARRRSTSRRRCTSCARSQVVELSPADAERLGDRARATASRSASNGTRVRGAVRLRAAVPSGSVFLAAARTRAGQRAHRGARRGPPRRRARRRRPRRGRAGRRRRPRARRGAAVRAAGDPADRPASRGTTHERARRGRLLRGRGGSSSSRRW